MCLSQVPELYNFLITNGYTINEAFSTNVITPGVTSTNDVVWWMREKVKKLGLKTWFHPTIDVQRNENSELVLGKNIKEWYENIFRIKHKCNI